MQASGFLKDLILFVDGSRKYKLVNARKETQFDLKKIQNTIKDILNIQIGLTIYVSAVS